MNKQNNRTISEPYAESRLWALHGTHALTVKLVTPKPAGG